MGKVRKKVGQLGVDAARLALELAPEEPRGGHLGLPYDL